MKILGLIPARGGSKGIPGKNIKLLGQKPLIQYTIETALKVKKLNAVCVSTDSEEIKQFCKTFPILVPFIRPHSLALDDTPTIDVVVHAIQYFKNNGVIYDAVCLLQPTYPLREENFIDNAIEKFIQSKSDSLISVLEVPHHHNPHWVFESDKKGYLHISTGEDKIISRRQLLPKAYFRDGSIYLTKTNTILDDKSLFGKTISYIISSRDTYLNIDTKEDWDLAETLIKNIKKGAI